jgi:protein-L-isoaspartate(D-aspartate) O-methyltransferase
MNAMMCELLNLEKNQTLLEIGTGSGYHAALCASIVAENDRDTTSGHVYTVERHKRLVQFARDNIKRAGLENAITVIHGDGTKGYPDHAPYDRILVTAAGPEIPEPLISQLKIGGKLCIPVGEQRYSQTLMVVSKTSDGIQKESVCNVVFVPLVGKYGHK